MSVGKNNRGTFGTSSLHDTKQRFNWEEAAELEQEHNTGVHVQK